MDEIAQKPKFPIIHLVIFWLVIAYFFVITSKMWIIMMEIERNQSQCTIMFGKNDIPMRIKLEPDPRFLKKLLESKGEIKCEDIQ